MQDLLIYLKRNWLRLAAYLLGMILISIAITMEVDARVGISALDMAQSNIAFLINHSRENIGIGVFIGSGSLLLIAIFVRKNLKPIWAIIPLVAISLLVNVFDDIIYPIFSDALSARIIEYILSVVVICVGAAMMIVSKLPPTPYDTLVISLVEVTGKPITRVRIPIELIFLAFGAILAYAAGTFWESLNVGTILYGIVTSYVLQFFVHLFKRMETRFIGNKE